MLSQFVQFPISSNLLETAQVWPKTKSYLAAALHDLPWNYDETSRAASVRGSGEITPRAFRCGKLWNMLTMGKFWPWVQRMFWAISNLNMLIRSANVWPELAVLSLSLTEHDVFFHLLPGYAARVLKGSTPMSAFFLEGSQWLLSMAAKWQNERAWSCTGLPDPFSVLNGQHVLSLKLDGLVFGFGVQKNLAFQTSFSNCYSRSS